MSNLISVRFSPLSFSSTPLPSPHNTIVRWPRQLSQPFAIGQDIIAVLIGVVQARQNIRDPTGANNSGFFPPSLPLYSPAPSFPPFSPSPSPARSPCVCCSVIKKGLLPRIEQLAIRVSLEYFQLRHGQQEYCLCSLCLFRFCNLVHSEEEKKTICGYHVSPTSSQLYIGMRRSDKACCRSLY